MRYNKDGTSRANKGERAATDKVLERGSAAEFRKFSDESAKQTASTPSSRREGK